ncbi:MAG: UPF0102 protein [Rhodomicrobium sp.]|nr:MAG: UPF0102 protein [Rhodomicrobium sp.]
MANQNKRSAERYKRQRSGARAERVAALYLQLRGYRILERRYKCPVGEIDLIVRRGGVIGFVEVKYRQTFEAAAWSLSQVQKQRIGRAAGHWLMGHEGAADKSLRFDVMLVVPWQLPRYMTNAFDGVGF